MNVYPGAAFAPDLEGGRAEGDVRFAAGVLRFETGSGVSLELPLEGLVVRLGGASDRLVFFEHAARPGVSIYTAAPTILDDPTLAALPELVAQVDRAKRRRRLARATAVAIVATLALAVWGIVSLKDPLVRFAASRVPVSVETSLGDAAFERLSATTVPVRDEDVAREVGALVAPLVAAVPQAGYAFRFHVVDDPTLNAFALPGGNVVLHSGLILSAETPEEVLGVVAHELAHVTERHGLRQLMSNAGVFALLQAVFGDVSGLTAVVIGGGAQLLTLRFSRDLERDADEVGVEYLLRAGVDPVGLVAFLGRLRNMMSDSAAGPSAAEVPAFLGTHPATDERIERLERRVASLEGFDFVELDLRAFDRLKRELREAVSSTASDVGVPLG